MSGSAYGVGVGSLPAQPELLLAIRALAADAVSAEVISAFQAASIPSILLKGPSIARWLYARGGRSYGDTDLLVRDADFAAAADVLRRLGFVEILDGWAGAERPVHEVACAFVRAGRAVDLHRSLPHIPVASDVVWETFGAHVGTLVIGGVEATVLDTTALALHVVLHAVQHGNAKHTAEDLRRAVAALPAEQWSEVAALAATLGVENELAMGLSLDPAGEAVARALGVAAPVMEASAAWLSFAPRGAGSLDKLVGAPTLGAKLRVARWTILPSPAKIRYVAGGAMAPTRRALLAAYWCWWAGLARATVPALRYTARRLRRRRVGERWLAQARRSKVRSWSTKAPTSARARSGSIE